MTTKKILFVLFLLFMIAPFSAAKASPMAMGVCEAIADAREQMPLLYVQSNCAQANREVMYGAAAAVSGYNPANTQAVLGMLQVENGCGGQASTATCDGRYTIRAGCSGCTAYGSAQIIRDTWIGLTSGSNRTALINRLGGCGAQPAAGSLSTEAGTRNGTARGQFEAFRRALCDNPGGVSSASGHQQWGGYSAVSILVANQLDGRSTVVMGNNSGAVTALNGLSINASEVGMYCTHNLGEGGCNSFMRGMSSNPNASVANTLSASVMRNNWGLYCTDRTCSQPLSYAQAAQRMSASMRRGNCVTEGLSRIGAQPTGTVPVSPNGVYAQPGVNTQAGLDSARALAEIQAANDEGGAPGEMRNTCMTGASVLRSSGACQAVTPDQQQYIGGSRPDPAAISGGNVTGNTGGNPTAGGTTTAANGRVQCTAANNLGAGCAVIGDSIANGTGGQFGGCNYTAPSGNVGKSANYIANNLPAGTFNTVVLSVGSNPSSNQLADMQRIRAELERRNPNVTVLWIQPSSTNAVAAPSIPNVQNVAGQYGDRVLPFTGGSADSGLHPASYANVARDVRAALCAQ